MTWFQLPDFICRWRSKTSVSYHPLLSSLELVVRIILKWDQELEIELAVHTLLVITVQRSDIVTKGDPEWTESEKAKSPHTTAKEIFLQSMGSCNHCNYVLCKPFNVFSFWLFGSFSIEKTFVSSSNTYCVRITYHLVLQPALKSSMFQAITWKQQDLGGKYQTWRSLP